MMRRQQLAIPIIRSYKVVNKMDLQLKEKLALVNSSTVEIGLASYKDIAKILFSVGSLSCQSSICCNQWRIITGRWRGTKISLLKQSHSKLTLIYFN